MHPRPLNLGHGQGLPACTQSRCLQVPGHPRELGQIPTPRGCHSEPLPLPPSRRVYKPLIPSYKRHAPCQGSSGACCHSRGWKATPASIYGYRTSCSVLGTDGGMAHLTGSRPSKDEGGGRVCTRQGRPRSPATPPWSKRAHPSCSSPRPKSQDEIFTRGEAGQVSLVPLNLHTSPCSANMSFV